MPNPTRKQPNPKNKTASWFNIKASADSDHAEVLIYDEIGYWGVTAADFVAQLNALNVTTIDLRINSPGGSVFEGMAIYNAIRRHKATVTTHIDGLAASMASIIALAGDTVQMAENAYYMIHNPWGGCFGEAKDMRKYAARLDEMREQLTNIYQAKTGMDRDALLAAMDAETWYTGTTASEAGFIDELTETLDAAACFYGDTAIGHFVKPPIPFGKISPPESTPEPPQATHSKRIAAKLDLLRLTDNL